MTSAGGRFGTRRSKPGSKIGKTGARVRCIGSDPRRAHGLAPVLVLADEPAQHPETTGERMVAALTHGGRQATP